MKTRVIVGVALAVAFAIGYIGYIGYYGGAYRERVAYDHFFMNSAYLQAALDTDNNVRVLTYLGSGQTNDAFNLLETLLDGSLTTFVRYDTAPPNERNDSVLHAIRDARNYREKHPWSTSSITVDTNIQHVFLLAK